MVIRAYTQEQLELAKKFLSPDAFMYLVCDALARMNPLSAVGFGDGERAIMQYTQKPASFLHDPKYLREYGLTAVNLGMLGGQLASAALRADWFCPLIHGVYLDNFDVIRLTPRRERYVERLFPYAWFYMGREKELMKHSKIAVVCRNSFRVAYNLQKKYGCAEIQPIEYGSAQDSDSAYEALGKSDAGLVLCAVGPSGKYLIVKAARSYRKVVLDIGSALINKWQVI